LKYKAEGMKEELYGPNIWLIEEMYRQYKEEPASVAESWRDFFSGYKPVTFSEKPIQVEEAKPARPVKHEDAEPLKGFAARIVENMEASLTVPTATSARIIPVKVMEENRRIINQYLANIFAGKVSFTHLIAWAILKALKEMPVMTTSFLSLEGIPHKVRPKQINFGLAIDVERKDGTRSLLVPNIKQSEQLDFNAFFKAYNELLRKVKANAIEPDDFLDTTVSLTNPGMIGTVHSAPRLMTGQSCIIATGAIDYPAEYQSADPRVIARLGISKVMTMTCTYDHRVIQGAESGTFLKLINHYLNGKNDFYHEIFTSLKVPYQVIRLQPDYNPVVTAAESGDAMFEKQAKVLQLINMYRVRGHLLAYTNPLSDAIKVHAELDPENYGLTLWDLDRTFNVLNLAGRTRMTLRDAWDILREAYCYTIGIEYMHIQDPEEKAWIQHRVEGVTRESWLDSIDKKRILYMLNSAEAFENFLHTKYIGHKRFSLEGAETLIPMLDRLLRQAIQHGIKETVIGMAHRGRLNVLANILGKSYRTIFREFEGHLDPDSPFGSGDVKYHLGAKGKYVDADGNAMDITLASNPSHLEAVNPVVEGMVRARQDIIRDTLRQKIMAVLIHGDAAFAGQGVVAETLNLSGLIGYRTGGTIHIVVNNGIGFTTAPQDARSSTYATDIAKMVQAPIFHLNGEDPEACVHTVELAFKYRQKFQKDVVIDLICYRRHGHNESDEPAYTQPLMYAQIKEKRSIRKLYTEALVNHKDISLEEAEAALEEYQRMLNTAFESTKTIKAPQLKIPEKVTLVKPQPPIKTSVSKEILQEIAMIIGRTPEKFTIHPKLKKQILNRKEAVTAGKIDWALAESLAFGSLLLDDVPIRLSGQDSRRGTFSQRHAVFVDYQTNDTITPLNHIRDNQEKLMIFDSLLSEYAVLGFEYGYSVVRKEALVLWEAQFGDFVNGAQIIIDQFISSAEEKWGQSSRLVLLLPHGYEGQGPEHSSSRVERFLTLCAEANLRVTVPTNAAQYFHLLRDQALREPIKPLIVLTPKSLLRADSAKCKKESLIDGTFEVIACDPKPPDNPQKIIFCSGKIFYDLQIYRDKHKINNSVIVRLEQLYPFPFDQVTAILKRYTSAKEIHWVQDEPRNMGFWTFVLPRFREVLTRSHTLSYVGRLPSASPAAGSYLVHEAEQQLLIRQAFSNA
jgi:2-oxoglutarate decarboxylase